MYRYLARLRSDITAQWEQEHQIISPNAENMLNTLLTSIAPNEQQYLANHFKCEEWNVGSPFALLLLQRAKILSMSDYLIHQMNEEPPLEDVAAELPMSQLILNDLLETVVHQLLANVVEQSLCGHHENGARAIRLNDAIEECLRRLFNDLCSNPNAIQSNYLLAVTAHLSSDHMRAFRMMHLRVLMELDSSSAAVALERRTSWTADFPAANTMFNQIFTMLFSDPDDTPLLLNQLFCAAVERQFVGWKWYLKCLHCLQQQVGDGYSSIIRQFLRQLFQKYAAAATNDVLHKESIFILMLLTARQSFGFNGEVGRGERNKGFGSYSKWYKENVGEMQYRQTIGEFKETMATLMKIVQWEFDVDALEVHAGCSIAAPAHCNELVYSYRQMCRARLMELKTSTAADSDIEILEL